MQTNIFRSALLLLIIFNLVVPAATVADPLQPQPTRHDLTVRLDTHKREIIAVDKITLYPGKPSPSKNSQSKNTIRLRLHSNYKFTHPLAKTLDPFLLANGWKIVEHAPENSDGVSTRILEIKKNPSTPWPEKISLTLNYQGALFDPLRSQENAPALENDDGIFLSGAAYFYPQLKASAGRMTFKLTVHTPSGWRAVSQGKLVDDEETGSGRTAVWQTDRPQEEIYLIADRFHATRKDAGNVALYAYLLDEEPALAEKYLNAAKTYIEFFEKLLGPYPYEKFALVENSLQTGYGMPSFTLLGSRIIRFPFILHTSYPHEILHNWLGNGVYLDPASGNWAEGLTTYLSDHLLAELKGKGEKFRFQEMMKYMSYVDNENDFPLSEFKGRESMASQAVGYGKLVMVLHMLRVELGEKTFLESLREFYAQNRFRHAGFDDLRRAFEKISGKNLETFFRQWIDRKGAPDFHLAEWNSTPQGDGFNLQVTVAQNSEKPLFEFNLPVAVWIAGKPEPIFKSMRVKNREATGAWRLNAEPLAVLLDPYYEVFRRLDPREAPPSIGQTYGNAESVVVLPDGDPLISSYEKMARGLNAENPESILKENKFSKSEKRSLWILGRYNRHAKSVEAALKNYGVLLDKTGATLDGKRFPWKDHSFVFTVRNPEAPGSTLTWILVDNSKSVPGLIRKLPHYGKFGYLAFSGEEPVNQVRGVWPADRAGLMKEKGQGDYALLPKPPLIDFEPRFQ